MIDYEAAARELSDIRQTGNAPRFDRTADEMGNARRVVDAALGDLYELHRDMQTGDLQGGWIGANRDGMDSDDGVFEYVFIPVANKCSRCDGTGQVYDEVFENEWTKCPYWDHDAGLQCVDGLAVLITEENNDE